MQQIPDTQGLLTAVAEWLDALSARSLTGADRYEARVAVNVLRIVERELVAGPGGHDADRAAFTALLRAAGRTASDRTDPASALAHSITTGEIDPRSPGLLDVLHAWTARKVAVNNPAYLLPDDRA